jgi:hypothetical protein
MGVAPKSAASVHAGGGDLRWLNQLAAISESPHAVNRLLENWNVKDLDAMGLWLRENRDFRFYNLAAERYAQTLDDVDPAAARQWRDSLKENQPR